jgi:hypothetical protein
MSDEARTKVDTILSAAGVAFNATLIGETTKDNGGGEPWVCDAWVVTFTVTLFGRIESQRFDYFTGTGQRKPNPSIIAQLNASALAKVSKRMLAWEQHYKSWPDVPQAPHAADVLQCLILDSSAASQSFADWCSDYGYDTDSRKAFAVYEACQQSGDKLRKIFTRDELSALADALQDY